MATDHPAKPGVSLDTLPDYCVQTWPGHDHRVQRRIVCAANRFEMKDGTPLVIPASRHYSPIMRSLAKRLAEEGIIKTVMVSGENQGFIDQFDNYHTRKVAMDIVKHSGQPFNEDLNGGDGDDLYSEGLY